MALWTTYLAFLRKVNWNPCNVFPDELEETIFLYVMRNRGNDEVAPSDDWWKPFKKLAKVYPIEELWEHYEDNYLLQIGLSKDAINWMQNTAYTSKRANIVLICYEKNAQYCHRRLLAEELARRFGADYRGELNSSHLKKSGGGGTK